MHGRLIYLFGLGFSIFEYFVHEKCIYDNSNATGNNCNWVKHHNIANA